VITRRTVMTGLAVLAGITLATTGCTKTPGAPATPTTPAKSPTEILSDAAAKAKGQSFKYTLAYGTDLTADGAQDATGANATRNIAFANAGVNIKGNVRLIGDSLYAKLDLGPAASSIPGLAGLGSKWVVLDKKKIGNSGLAASLVPGGDTGTPETYIKGVVSAEKVSDTEFKGTIDLTKAAPAAVPANELASLAPETKNAPFTAKLDEQGRINTIVIKMPKVGSRPAADLTTTFTDYGASVDVPKPAPAETVTAPEAVYAFLQ
jgi:hypothetical protein